MAGIYSRKLYDECYNTEFINQQVNPCRYRTLDEFAENKLPCNAINGPRTNKIRGTGELGKIDDVNNFTNYINSNNGFRTEIESQLYNLDIPDSRCITMNTLEEKNQRINDYIKKLNVDVKYNECNQKQDETYSLLEEQKLDNNNYNYTRLNHPVNNLRSVFINRFNFPIIDPQEFIYNGYDGSAVLVENDNINQNGNERFGQNTQLRAKDSIYKPKLPKFSILLNE
jgi:hypothetical protein